MPLSKLSIESPVSFDFPSEVFAVISIRYEKDEINPRIISILHRSDDVNDEDVDVVLGYSADFGDVSVFYPDGATFGSYVDDVLGLQGGIIASNSSGFRSLLGKHATLCSTESDGPVLVVWTGEVPETSEERMYQHFANRAAQLLGGIDRLYSDRWERWI